ncbi:MAG TPA: hypothetical protein VLF89_04825 [Candidatus Saccharimonadales bacterium]|nr:hypothetical protein [Candidatus Saccharimonadales bacterium]
MTKEQQGIISQRVNITPQARIFAIEGVKPVTKRDPLNKRYKTRKKALEVWLPLEKEAYEITAVISARVINRAANSRYSYPPYGIFTYGSDGYEPITALQTFTDVRKAMKTSLDFSQHEEISDLTKKLHQRQFEDPIVSVYARYQKLYNFAKNNLERPMEAILDINAGLNTAEKVMTWTLENILEVYQREHRGIELSFPGFKTIADNTYPYIAEVAMMHKHRLNQMSYDPKDYTLIQSAKGARLQMTEAARMTLEQKVESKEIADIDLRETFGCPAMVNFGDGPAIKKLWDWHIDIAELMYQQNCVKQKQSIYSLAGN